MELEKTTGNIEILRPLLIYVYATTTHLCIWATCKCCIYLYMLRNM